MTSPPCPSSNGRWSCPSIGRDSGFGESSFEAVYCSSRRNSKRRSCFGALAGEKQLAQESKVLAGRRFQCGVSGPFLLAGRPAGDGPSPEGCQLPLDHPRHGRLLYRPPLSVPALALPASAPQDDPHQTALSHRCRRLHGQQPPAGAPGGAGPSLLPGPEGGRQRQRRPGHHCPGAGLRRHHAPHPRPGRLALPSGGRSAPRLLRGHRGLPKGSWSSSSRPPLSSSWASSSQWPSRRACAERRCNSCCGSRQGVSRLQRSSS